MEARKIPAAGGRVYHDFVPPVILIQEAEMETHIVNLPGFQKEQLKMQIIEDGKLIITGERPLLHEQHWSRFRREVPVPDNCNTKDISAKFVDEYLYIALPKLLSKDKPSQAQRTPSSHNVTAKTEPSGSRDDTSKKGSRSDAEKVEAEAKDHLEEPKDTQKNTSQDKDEDEAAVEPTQAIDRGGGGSRLGKPKLKMGRLDFEWYKTRPLISALVNTIVVLVGLGLYLHYKLSPKDTHAYTDD